MPAQGGALALGRSGAAEEREKGLATISAQMEKSDGEGVRIRQGTCRDDPLRLHGRGGLPGIVPPGSASRAPRTRRPGNGQASRSEHFPYSSIWFIAVSRTLSSQQSHEGVRWKESPLVAQVSSI